MTERPLPESEESKREKYGRWITRAAWIAVVILGILLALYVLLGGSGRPALTDATGVLPYDGPGRQARSLVRDPSVAPPGFHRGRHERRTGAT